MGTRRRTTLAAGALGLCALAALAAGTAPAGVLEGGERRPSVVLITTDDQTFDSLRVMRRTKNLIAKRGARFRNHIVSFPLCCPSRATWITGQYAHNHGVIDNQARNGGGYGALRDPDQVLPAWLDAAGYDTALVGKWVHDYHSLRRPPGWDRFHALVEPTVTRYYGYEIADSRGGKRRHGEDASDYLTDVLTREYAVPFIDARRRDPDPFFLHLSYTAPHWGKGRRDRAGRRCASRKPFKFDTARAKPAPRHATRFRRRPLPRPPSLNERDVSDKPPPVSGKRRLRKRELRDLRQRYRCELASLLAVDEAVKQVDDAIARSGRAGETYVVFASDNGYMRGEHRVRGEKAQPYEESIRVPFLIRGPGIAPGMRISDPVSNVDLAPTIMELTGVAQPSGLLAAPPRLLDGRSLVPQLGGASAPGRAILIESKRPPRRSAKGRFVAPSWVGVRTRRYVYVEHHRAVVPTLTDGFGLEIGAGEVRARELYDLAADRFQLRSVHDSPAYAAARDELARMLARLRSCEGAECHVDASVPPPSR